MNKLGNFNQYSNYTMRDVTRMYSSLNENCLIETAFMKRFVQVNQKG